MIMKYQDPEDETAKQEERILNSHANWTRARYDSTLQILVHIGGAIHLFNKASMFIKNKKMES